MTDTPDLPKTPEQSEAFIAVVTALGDAVFLLLSDDTFTEEEAESFSADTNEVAFLSLGAFDPQVIDTETLDDGSKKFTFSMTIPETDTFDTFWNHYKEVIGEYPTDDDDEDDEDEE
jgi:maltose-binding protein MalE